LNIKGKGRGAGVEELYVRRQFALHMIGHNWNDAVIAEQFPTWAEISNPLNWARVFPERKQVPVAFLLTLNG